MRDLRAETVKAVRRPAHWLLLGVAAALSVTFGYLVPYAGYAAGTSGPPSADRGLPAMLPGAFVGSALGGMPVFVGALCLVFGVLLVGSEYGWDTWKTVLLQRGSRTAVYRAKIAVAGLGVAVAVGALFAVAATSSAVVATLEGRPLAWPSPPDVLAGAGAGWLICMTWAALGVLLAVTLRGVALPIGLGLVWLLAVQNLLSAIAAPLLDWVAQAQKALPGPNAGSLVASLGAPPETPGVAVLVGQGWATGVLVAYGLTFVLVAGWVLHRQDL